MRNRLTSAIVPLFALLLLVIAGCGEPETGDNNNAGFDATQIQPVRIIHQDMGDNEAVHNALDEPSMLIQSQDQLDALDFDFDVNFDTQNVVIVSIGQQNTGGYWVKITGARRDGDTLRVTAVANRPDPDQVQTQQLTYPYAIALVPRTDVTNLDVEYTQVVGESPEDHPVTFGSMQSAPAPQEGEYGPNM